MKQSTLVLLRLLTLLSFFNQLVNANQIISTNVPTVDVNKVQELSPTLAGPIAQETGQAPKEGTPANTNETPLTPESKELKEPKEPVDTSANKRSELESKPEVKPESKSDTKLDSEMEVNSGSFTNTATATASVPSSNSAASSGSSHVSGTSSGSKSSSSSESTSSTMPEARPGGKSMVSCVVENECGPDSKCVSRCAPVPDPDINLVQRTAGCLGRCNSSEVIQTAQPLAVCYKKCVNGIFMNYPIATPKLKNHAKTQSESSASLSLATSFALMTVGWVSFYLVA